MSEPIKFAVVGLGGYGKSHLDSAADIETQELGILDAVVCIDPQNHTEKLADFKQRGVRIFNTLDDLIQAGGVDVITLPIGIHDHVRLSIACLEAGFNVLVEKPLTGAIQDANRLIDVRNKTGKTIIIGYQHLYSQTIQGLKERILDGRLGPIKMARLKASWPRGSAYYSRNPWAGTQKRDGVWTLDSPINNALAHYLTNIFYLCGTSPETSCGITSVHAELYRAWDIENLDTACLRVQTDADATALIAMSHVGENRFGPIMDLECENGTAHWAVGTCEITYQDGKSESIDDNDARMRTLPWVNMVNALQKGERVTSSLEVGRSQTLCINGAHESCSDIHNIPSDAIKTVMKNEQKFLVVNDLENLLHKSADDNLLFSEMNVPWAKKSEPYLLDNYTQFPTGK